MKKGIRVCFVTGAYPPAVCGVGDYTANLCGALAKQGLDVSVVASSYLGIPRQEYDNPRVFPVINSWHIQQARRAIQAINQVEPDVVAFQIPHLEYRRRIFCNLLIPLIKAFRPSAKVVVTFHEMLDRRDVSWKRALNIARIIVSVARADAVVLVAPTYIHTFQAVVHKLWPASRKVSLYVIPIASNIGLSSLSADELCQLRQQMGFSNQSVVLAYFGFINADKGFDDALRVVSGLRERRIPAHLLMIGRLDSADPYHRAMREWIVRERLESHITVTGVLSAERVADYLAMSDACLLPFRSGVHAKSGTFLAAKTQGVFVVTTSTNGTGYREQENVYYAEPGDIDSMVQAVCTYAGGRLGPSTVHRPDWDKVAERYHELFRNLSLAREPK